MTEENRIATENSEDTIPKRALLVSVFKGGSETRKISEEHLQELSLLAETYGIEVIKKTTCGVRKYEAATLVTEGKLQELIDLAKENEIELVVFDDELPPSQQRNLEKIFNIPVIDRTELILGVFAQRAQTKEARLQIELAQVQYQAPRLKRLWSHLSRQSGGGGGGGGRGGGYQKGEGEKQLEIDRRLLKQEIAQLQSELNAVKHNRETQRAARMRSPTPVISIIGYTNAGKSTLLNALTDADVFVEDKLFATLDTTTRKYTLSNNQQILLTDTVGFIRKLPHLLVAAFKSTLEEALAADILLHLIDASHPMAEEQAKTTMDLLKELGAKDTPIITLINKIDKPESREMALKLRLAYPKTVMLSALEKTGFDDLEEMIIEEISKKRKTVTMRIPQSNYAVVSELIRLGNILSKEYEEDDVVLRADLPLAIADKFKKYKVEDE